MTLRKVTAKVFKDKVWPRKHKETLEKTTPITSTMPVWMVYKEVVNARKRSVPGCFTKTYTKSSPVGGGKYLTVIFSCFYLGRHNHR